jgi:hypothetical protein
MAATPGYRADAGDRAPAPAGPGASRRGWWRECAAGKRPRWQSAAGTAISGPTAKPGGLPMFDILLVVGILLLLFLHTEGVI